MNYSKQRFVVWVCGLVLPAWAVIFHHGCASLFHEQMPQSWFHLCVLLGTVFCTMAILATQLSPVKRLLLVTASWLLLAGEVALISSFGFLKW